MLTVFREERNLERSLWQHFPLNAFSEDNSQIVPAVEPTCTPIQGVRHWFLLHSIRLGLTTPWPLLSVRPARQACLLLQVARTSHLSQGHAWPELLTNHQDLF